MFIIMNRFLLILSIVFLGFVGASAQTTVEGKVTDTNTGESILFGAVKLFRGGVLISGAETDIDGNYYFSNVQPGTYDMEVEYVGYGIQRQTGITIKAGKTNRIDFKLSNEDNVLTGVEIIEYKVPLIEIDNTTQGATLTAEKIRSMPTKSINGIAATSAGISSRDGGAMSIRGSRSDETVYFLDGVRVTGNLIPQSEIEQLQVVVGGIEARYGDVTGGVISLTSKGPSSKVGGTLEIEKGLDGYGYNLFSGNIAGPIYKKNNKSILGYRFSGQYRTVADNSPSATGVWRASEDVIKRLESNTTYSVGNSRFASFEQLTSADIPKTLRARPNDDNTTLDLTGRFDVRVNDNIDFQVSGNYNDTRDRFTPDAAWSLLNWTNNPYDYNNTYRGNFRMTHKLGRQSLQEATSGEKSSSALKNLYYTFTLGYQKETGRNEDLRHKDSLFNYGYYGKTARTWEPAYGFVNPALMSSDPYQHVGYREVVGESTVDPFRNPVLGSYAAISGVLTNGLVNDVLNDGWNGLYSNVGRVYNNFSKSDNDLYSFNLSTGFDLLPGGSEKGRHNILIGFIYEQSINRSYSLSPTGLWVLADQSANNHINGIDSSKIIGVDPEVAQPPFFNAFAPENIYDTKVNPDPDNKFYRSVRELLSTEGKVVRDQDYVNVWDIDPSQLSLSMFSANELINRQGLISYQGYDYLGNKLGNDVRFEDFFTAKDAQGKRSFVVAPQQPIYGAVFLQDKFSYKDIIFRLGMRVDYYDANTKVMRDPYALYEIENAKDYYNRLNVENPDANIKQPSSVGDDYNVYVEGDESDKLVAFRKGDQWFLPNGTGASSLSIFQDGAVFPSYAGKKKGRVLNIQDPNFDVNTSFVDYKPQINFMPRLAFSFPISEDAGFFAHYDVLYQRPSNSYASPLDFYFWNTKGRLNPNGAAFANPNLKPFRTVDYEVGFQRKISSTAAMKVSAFYKEIKDLIQQRTLGAVAEPINEYKIFDNLDFGTVKGFSFSLDRRRTNNLELNATYTLQFADGSGSDANSSSGINKRGPIRNLIPLSYDERHRITTVVDYRFPSGKGYTGPKIGKVGIFSDLGISMTNFLVSGQPYTRNTAVAERGGSGYASSINGARLPWNFISDLNVTKRFPITINKTSGKQLFFNAVCRVQNLFNTRNIVDLYKFSNDAYNDGYLVSVQGQDREKGVVDTGRNLEAFRAAYAWRLNAPGHFNLPRRVYLGVTMDF
jgi:outer membrane receptor protein involved in Fe transport